MPCRCIGGCRYSSTHS